MERQAIPCPECDREKYFEGLCYYCKRRKQREYYENLSSKEIEEKIQYIIDNIEEIEEREYFIGLLAYQNINTQSIAAVAFEHKIYSPEELYRDASDEVQEALINKISSKISWLEANEILSALAHCPTQKVQNAFLQWERDCPKWRKERDLYVNPSVYAEGGGWTFDENGEKTDLIYFECYALLPENREDNAVKVLSPKGEEKCGICGCQIYDILSIDGTDERLKSFNLKGKVNLSICPNCAMMSDKIIIRYQPNGESNFEVIEPYAEENYFRENEHIGRSLRLSLKSKPIFYARGQDEVSVIGGNPEWVQDSQYENCPDCGKKMKLLAAMDWGQLLEDEGILYIEHCTDCYVAVAFHQQT